MQSLESSALEPTKAELKGASLSTRMLRFLPVYGLVILTGVLLILFSVLLPNTFPTMLNLRAIISDKAIIALLSLGAMIPMAAGRIDLTVGYGIVLWHILAISLQTLYGLPWPFAVLIVLFLGVFTGFLNGWLVEVAKIDSFIATLGTGTVLYALALWHTGGRQMVGVLPDGFLALNGTFIFGLPITGFYLLGITILMWVVLEYTPVGRYLYAIGANQKAAQLNGIPTRKFVVGAFMSSGFLTALAGDPCIKIADWSGECRAGIPVAGSCWRVPWVNYDQAGACECLGHNHWCGDPRHRYFGHPAIWWLVLGRTAVQRRDPFDRNRYRRLRTAAQRRQKVENQQQSGRKLC